MEKYNGDSKRVRQKTPDQFVKRTTVTEIPGNTPEIRVSSSTSFSKSQFRAEPTNPNTRSVIIQQQTQKANKFPCQKSSEDRGEHRKSSEISGTTYTDRFEEHADINKPLQIEILKNFTSKPNLPPQSPNFPPNPPKTPVENRRKSTNSRGASPLIISAESRKFSFGNEAEEVKIQRKNSLLQNPKKHSGLFDYFFIIVGDKLKLLENLNEGKTNITPKTVLVEPSLNYLYKRNNDSDKLIEKETELIMKYLFPEKIEMTLLHASKNYEDFDQIFFAHNGPNDKKRFVVPVKFNHEYSTKELREMEKPVYQEFKVSTNSNDYGFFCCLKITDFVELSKGKSGLKVFYQCPKVYGFKLKYP
jgi:hypothetical protein